MLMPRVAFHMIANPSFWSGSVPLLYKLGTDASSRMCTSCHQALLLLSLNSLRGVTCTRQQSKNLCINRRTGGVSRFPLRHQYPLRKNNEIQERGSWRFSHETVQFWTVHQYLLRKNSEIQASDLIRRRQFSSELYFFFFGCEQTDI